MSKEKSQHNNDSLLDGKFLSKSELTKRLSLMGSNPDEIKDANKSRLNEIYNQMVLNVSKRKKIKSFIESDIIDRPDKNLNRKRERDVTNFNTDSNPASPEETSVKKSAKTKQSSSKKNNTKTKASPNITKKPQNVSYEQMLDVMKKYVETVSHDVEIQNGESNVNSSNKNNYNEITFSKEHGGSKSKIFNEKNQQIEISPMVIEEQINRPSQQIKVPYIKKLTFHEITSDQKPKVESNFQEYEIPETNKFYEENKDIQGKILLNNSKISEKSEENYFGLIEPMKSENIKENFFNQKTSSNNNLLKLQLERKNSELSRHSQEIYKSKNNSVFNGDHVNENKSFKRTDNSLPQVMTNFRVDTQELKRTNSSSDLIRGPIRRSQPGSKKNIQEILQQVEIKSPNNSANNLPVINPIRSSNSLNRIGRSEKSVNISIRDIPNFCSQQNNNSDGFRKVSNLVDSIFHADPLVLFSGILGSVSFLGIGMVLCDYHFGYLNLSDENKPDKYYVIIGLSVVIFLCFVFIYIRRNSNKFNYLEKIAKDDYFKIYEILEQNYQSENQPVGVFESSFIKNLSQLHNMTEQSYRINVLPLIEKKIKRDKDIQVQEIVIQGQAQKVWNFRSLN